MAIRRAVDHRSSAVVSKNPRAAISLEDLAAGDYVLDPTHSRLGFVTRHAMVTRVHGFFERFSGRADLDVVDPSRSAVAVDKATTRRPLKFARVERLQRRVVRATSFPVRSLL